MSTAPILGFDAEDPDAWSVLADWLTQRGDPRGDLLALARTLELETQRSDAVLDELRRLRREHLPRFVEPVVRAFSAADEHELHRRLAGRWRGGVLHEARPLRSEPISDRELRRRLDRLLDTEAVVGLSVLRLDHVPPEIALAALADGPTRPTIRALALGDYRHPMPALGRLWAKLPGLCELELLGPEIDLGELATAVPRLARLRLCCEGDPAPIRQLRDGVYANLQRLELRLGGDDYVSGDTLPLDDWSVEQRLPRLEHLAIHGVDFDRASLDRLRISRLPRRVRSLDLSDNDLAGGLVAGLADADEYFAGVERLAVYGAVIEPDALALLRAAWADRLDARGCVAPTQ